MPTSSSTSGPGWQRLKTAILSNEFFRSTTGHDLFSTQLRQRHLEVAAGTRLAARGQSTITTADRTFDVAVVGFHGAT